MAFMAAKPTIRAGSCTGCSHDRANKDQPVRMSGFAELAAASNYSFLRGASHPAELVNTAN